jgi:hypothetical protein
VGIICSSRRLGMIVFLLFTAAFLLALVARFPHLVHESSDYRIVSSSARCLTDNCDPYNSNDMRRAYIVHDGDLNESVNSVAFRPYQALYLPSSLFWILPFTVLQWKGSLALWIGSCGLVMVVASALMADLCRHQKPTVSLILLGLFLALSITLLGNPSILAVGLCVIGVWCFLKDRYLVLGILCLGLSLAVKPQIAGLVVLYFLFSGRAPWCAIAVLVLGVILCLPGLLWITHDPAAANWRQELRVNLARSSAKGGLNDPGPTNWWGAADMTCIQALVSIFDNDPSVYNLAAYTVTGILLLIWAFIAWRAKPSANKDLLGVASIACLTLLPVYHRGYDALLLLLIFPAISLLCTEGGFYGLVSILLSIGIIVASHPHAVRSALGWRAEAPGPIRTLSLLVSPLPVLLAAIFFLVCFARTLRSENGTSVHPA